MIPSSYLRFSIPESQFSDLEYRISLPKPIRSSIDPNIFYSKLFRKETANVTAVGVELESNWSRDAVTLRIVEIDLSTLETLQAPTYRAVYLQQWTGQNHIAVFGKLKALAELWVSQHIVMDATGIGEGLGPCSTKLGP